MLHMLAGIALPAFSSRRARSWAGVQLTQWASCLVLATLALLLWASSDRVTAYAQAAPGSTTTPTQILITVDRTTYSSKSTVGRLNLFIDGVDQHLNAYSLEPSINNTTHPLLDPGTYTATLFLSPHFHFDVLKLEGTGEPPVEIHPGNLPEHTRGCILPGGQTRPDFVGYSRHTFARIMDAVERVKARGPAMITVRVSSGESSADPSDFTVAATDQAQPIDLIDSDCDTSSLLWGDTHLTTFDFLHYDFQAVGEFVLTKSTRDDFEVQVRQEPWGGSRSLSVATAVAMNVAGDRLGIYLRKTPAVRLNGNPLVLADGSTPLPNGGQVEKFGNQYQTIWPDGSGIRVDIQSGSLTIRGALPVHREGQLAGLLGNYDGNASNDLQARDGTLVDTSTFGAPGRNSQLYDRFANSWRVTQATSLFDYDSGESATAFNADTSFPDQAVSLASLDPATRLAAQTTCRQAGVTDPQTLNDCILDVGATGDSNFASGSAQLPEAQAGPPPSDIPANAPQTVYVYSLWTDTGITLNPGDSVTLQRAAGVWECCAEDWAIIPALGPDGIGTSDPSLLQTEWLQDGRQQELIGLIAPAGVDPRHAGSGFFAIGSGNVTKNLAVDQQGPSELWVGSNDGRTDPDPSSVYTSGDLSVQVLVQRAAPATQTPVPAPTISVPYTPVPVPTQQPAVTAQATATAAPVYALSDFLGTWYNPHPDGGWTRFSVTEGAGGLGAELWGECTPSECDSRTYPGIQVQVDPSGVPQGHMQITWDYQFELVRYTLTLLPGNRVRIDYFWQFNGNAYTSTLVFDRTHRTYGQAPAGSPSAAPTATPTPHVDSPTPSPTPSPVVYTPTPTPTRPVALTAPVQTSPASGAVFNNFPRTTTLRWQPVTGAAAYQVEIDCFNCCVSGQWCTDVGRTFEFSPRTTGTSWTFDFVGAQPGRWRVWGVDALGNLGPKTGWSGFRYTV